jgi:hypothetical protein
MYFGSWLQISVHGHLAPSLRSCGEAQHHDGEGVMEQRHLLHAAKKQRKTDRKEPEQDIPFEDTPPVTSFLQAGPTS